MRCYDEASLLSLETRCSLDSVDSRACLLGKPDQVQTSNTEEAEAACRQADLEHIVAHQARIEDAPMVAQRVVLSSAKQRDMQMAQVASTVNRMGRLRFANQDSTTVRDRRASDIEGFIDRLDRLGMKTMDNQRYSASPAPSCAYTTTSPQCASVPVLVPDGTAWAS
ncbi:hypothetical protein LPJ63_003287 [Coemansia sp. RSA 2711]|nr:hypothetical protein LPJ63_003287 [Coemansia sp. RSA 2711]KAJ2313402.1 hypothetical protein IWW54_001537 [Coemansia sp. RSA 2705]KAJ2390569.1 hypothetical protein H4S02_001786 [Coemansia sp. RSA 2611]